MPQPQPFTVLVVDDSPAALRLTSEALRQAGYRVVAATDGDLAIEVAQREQPQLVVLDIILPKKNGYEVCRQLKSMPDLPDLKVLLLSSKAHAADKTWGLRQGADGYLTKPYALPELLARTAELLTTAAGVDHD